LQRIEEVPFGPVMSEFNDTTPAAVPRSPTLVTKDDISGSLAVPRLPARTCAGCDRVRMAAASLAAGLRRECLLRQQSSEDEEDRYGSF